MKRRVRKDSFNEETIDGRRIDNYDSEEEDGDGDALDLLLEPDQNLQNILNEMALEKDINEYFYYLVQIRVWLIINNYPIEKTIKKARASFRYSSESQTLEREVDFRISRLLSPVAVIGDFLKYLAQAIILEEKRRDLINSTVSVSSVEMGPTIDEKHSLPIKDNKQSSTRPRSVSHKKRPQQDATNPVLRKPPLLQSDDVYKFISEYKKKERDAASEYKKKERDAASEYKKKERDAALIEQKCKEEIACHVASISSTERANYGKLAVDVAKVVLETLTSIENLGFPKTVYRELKSRIHAYQTDFLKQLYLSSIEGECKEKIARITARISPTDRRNDGKLAADVAEVILQTLTSIAKLGFPEKIYREIESRIYAYQTNFLNQLCSFPMSSPTLFGRRNSSESVVKAKRDEANADTDGGNLLISVGYN